MSKQRFYKITRPDGTDFWTGTVNYRDAIGSWVEADKSKPAVLCSSGLLHAADDPTKLPRFAKVEYPCAMFVVEGEPVTSDKDKIGFRRLFVRREIKGQKQIEKLLGIKWPAPRPDWLPVRPGMTLEQRQTARRELEKRAVERARAEARQVSRSMVCLGRWGSPLDHDRCKGDGPTGGGCLCECHDAKYLPVEEAS